MPPKRGDGLDSNPSYLAPGLRLSRCATGLGGATLARLVLFCDPRPPSNESLAALSQATERYMRSPAFLDLMRYSLKLMSRPIRFGFPNLPLRRRASQ